MYLMQLVITRHVFLRPWARDQSQHGNYCHDLLRGNKEESKGVCRAICYLVKKVKRVFASVEFQ